MPTKRILRNTGDVHCPVFHLVALLGYAGAFWIYLHPQRAHIYGPLLLAAFVATATVMLGWVSGLDVPAVVHNHVHEPFFTVPWLNRWVGRLWTFSGGWPSFFFEHGHLTVHHGNLLGRRDWTLPHRRPNGRSKVSCSMRRSIGHGNSVTTSGATSRRRTGRRESASRRCVSS